MTTKDNVFSDDAVGEIFDLINSSNILVFKCAKNIFSHFNRSIGSWISISLIGTHVLMTLTFLFASLAKIKKYIFSLTYNYLSFITKSVKPNPLTPPKKSISNSNSEKSKKNSNGKKNIKILKQQFIKNQKFPLKIRITKMIV